MKLFYVLQPFSHRCDVASPLLLYRHFHGECSGELHSLALKVRTDGSKTCHAMHIVVNHPHSLCVPLVIFPWTIALWNWLPRDCFPGHYNLKLFKSRINCYLPHISWASYWVNFILKKKKKNLRKLIWTNPHKKKCFINTIYVTSDDILGLKQICNVYYRGKYKHLKLESFQIVHICLFLWKIESQCIGNLKEINYFFFFLPYILDYWLKS